MADDNLGIDSSKCQFLDLAAVVGNYDESAEDLSWFQKQHPRILKPYGVDENAGPEDANVVNSRNNLPPPRRGGPRQKLRQGSSSKACRAGDDCGPSSSVASSSFSSSSSSSSVSSFASGAAAASSSVLTQGARKQRRTTGSGSGGEAAGAGADGSDDIMALLALHNKQFKPKNRYVARMHSSSDVRKWEVSERASSVLAREARAVQRAGWLGGRVAAVCPRCTVAVTPHRI
jgi:hypothetical protein